LDQRGPTVTLGPWLKQDTFGLTDSTLLPPNTIPERLLN